MGEHNPAYIDVEWAEGIMRVRPGGFYVVRIPAGSPVSLVADFEHRVAEIVRHWPEDDRPRFLVLWGEVTLEETTRENVYHAARHHNLIP